MNRFKAISLRGGWVLIAALLGGPLAAADLNQLVQEYGAAKPKARAGTPDQRRERARSTLKPILLKIAKVDTPEALGFVKKEFDTESPEIAGACVEALLAFTSEKGPEALLGNFAKRPRALKLEVLAEMARTKRDLAFLEPALAGLLQGEPQPEVRREFPAVLGKFDSVPASKALILSLGAGGGKGKAAQEELEYERRVEAVLEKTKSAAVKEWLAGEAFAGAPPARLHILARLAGDLKLEAARKELEKLIEPSVESLALDALSSLSKLGAGPSSARIAEGLKRGKRSLSFRIQALDAIASGGTEEGVAAVVEALKDPDADVRAIAAGSLARVPGANEAALDGLLRGLKDPEPQVRGSAARALSRIRHKKMVPALIDALGAEGEEKLKIDYLKLLIEITDQNMGLEVGDWRKWWEVTEKTFEFPKDAKAGGKLATAAHARDLKYFGIEVASKRLGFLVDISSSMTENVDVWVGGEKKEEQPSAGKTEARPAEGGGGDGKGEPKEEKKDEKKDEKKGTKTKARKIDILKKELARVIEGLSKDSQINLICFDAKPRPWQDTLQPLAGQGRQKAQDFVRGLSTGSGTNVFDSLEIALRDKRVDTIFLLTDGLPSRGRFTDGPSILREVRALNRIRGVTINCVAFGEESPFLKDLAKENGGVYRFVNSY
jgi:HEAT repeat protein